MNALEGQRYKQQWAAIRLRSRRELVEKHLTQAFEWERAVALIDFAASLHGWPLPESAVALREIEILRRKWTLLNAQAKAQRK
jgi:hypothetical protein